MTFPKLMIAAAAMLSTVGVGFAADAKDHRHDSRYERSHKGHHRTYRSDRDRRYDRADRTRNGDRRRGNNADIARRNYEAERDLQTCYRDGRRICR